MRSVVFQLILNLESNAKSKNIDRGENPRQDANQSVYISFQTQPYTV